MYNLKNADIVWNSYCNYAHAKLSHVFVFHVDVKIRWTRPCTYLHTDSTFSRCRDDGGIYPSDLLHNSYSDYREYILKTEKAQSIITSTLLWCKYFLKKCLEDIVGSEVVIVQIEKEKNSRKIILYNRITPSIYSIHVSHGTFHLARWHLKLKTELFVTNMHLSTYIYVPLKSKFI